MLELLAWPTRLPFSIEWEAWSTFVVGVLAVAAAWAVGRRQATITEKQANIADRQTQIMAQQVEHEALNLRAALYDRRINVVEAAQVFITEAIIADVSPGREAMVGLVEALARSQFLFGPEVSDWLRTVISTGATLTATRRRIEDLKHDEQQVPDVVNERLNDYLVQMANHGSEVHDVFSPYMRLTTVSKDTGVLADSAKG